MPTQESDDVAGTQRLEWDWAVTEPRGQEPADHTQSGGNSRSFQPSFLRQMLSELAHDLPERTDIDDRRHSRQYACAAQVLQEPPQPGGIATPPLIPSAPIAQESRELSLG
jgi:hypothetical protein